MKRALLPIALCALACGKQTFLAAAFVQTPAMPNPANPSQPFPQFQVMTAYFGSIDTSNPTNISADLLSPITDATASVWFHHMGTGGADVDQDRWLQTGWTSSGGTYTLNSNDQPQLTFEDTPYTLMLQLPGANGETFGARLAPGQPSDIVEFQNSSCTVLTVTTPRCRDAQVSQPMTLTRTDAAAAELAPAFVAVGQIDPANPTAQPQITYKTAPDSAVGLLGFVLSDRDFRQPSFTVPGSAFPQPGFYMVALLTVQQGRVSGNTFVGSIALAATGKAGIVHAQ